MKKGRKVLAEMEVLCPEDKLKPELTYKILFEDSGASIIIINKEGFYLFVNSRAADNMGGKPEDIIGRSILEFLPQKKAEKFLERNRRLIEAGTSEKYEDTFELPSGIKTFLITDHVLKDEDNKGYALQSSSIDITERKKSEVALHESEKMYRLITQNLPGTTVMLFDQNLRYLLFEGYLHPALGYSTNEIVGKTLWEVLPPSRAEQLAPIYQNALKGVPFENYISEFNDHVFSVNVMPVKNSQGLIDRGLIVSQDITERKQAEQTLQENEERLRALNATKDKFFSIIAHDLKSPFNSILGLSDFLVEQILEKKYENLEEYAATIRDSAQRTMNLLSTLMEWSRTQTGRMAYIPKKTEIVSLIEEVTNLLNDSARQKSIMILKELPDCMFAFVDNAMFSTVMRNLISNAIKFTNPGGKINVLLEDDIKYIRVSVHDTGIGINQDRIESLFRIDENHSTTGTQNEKGTGLGLILCKEFVEKHSGKIWVESVLDKGSTFFFTIPKVED